MIPYNFIIGNCLILHINSSIKWPEPLQPTLEPLDTYQTPYAFSKKGMKKKRKKNIEKQTGYKFVDEALSKEDINKIKKEIRKEVSDILFDIWVKRSSWGGK